MEEYKQQNEEQEIEPLHKRIVCHKAFLPFVLFFGLAILFGFSSRFSDQPPRIEDITPAIGSPGEVLVITGESFGDARQGGEVHIAGTRPTSSSYIEWSDERISVRIPPGVGSGLVSVITRNGKSKGMLFTNRDHIPVILEGPSQPGYPYIEEITPTKGSVGTLITISGVNYGSDRGNGKVYFTSLSEGETTEGQGQSEPDSMIAASESDYDYNMWSNREIGVYVPDGVTSGNIKVETDRGISNAAYFEVTEQVGTKQLGQRRGYQLQYGVLIDNFIGEEQNSIYLWIPTIHRGLYQNNIEISTETTPYWDSLATVKVYLFENIEPFRSYTVTHTIWFERAGVETQINPGKVVSEYNTERKLFDAFTGSDFVVPAQDEKVVRLAESIVGREKNPYRKARLVYDYILENYTYDEDPVEKDVVKSISKNEGDGYIYAVLYTALLRAAGVPARPVAGYLVYGNKRTAVHYWSEFYLEKFGWVQVDPFLGDGVRFMDVPEVSDPAEYYFGNLDNQHITFSRGIIETIQMIPKGKTVEKTRSYSFQRIYEEASPTVANYRSIWDDVTIVEWW
jgi:hypothetical protein